MTSSFSMTFHAWKVVFPNSTTFYDQEAPWVPEAVKLANDRVKWQCIRVLNGSHGPHILNERMNENGLHSAQPYSRLLPVNSASYPSRDS